MAASLPAFIVGEGARLLVRFEAFDFLLGGERKRHHAAVVMASTCRIPDLKEDASLRKRHKIQHEAKGRGNRGYSQF